jgi:hypothetical protein
MSGVATVRDPCTFVHQSLYRIQKHAHLSVYRSTFRYVIWGARVPEANTTAVAQADATASELSTDRKTKGIEREALRNTKRCGFGFTFLEQSGSSARVRLGLAEPPLHQPFLIATAAWS